MREASFVLRKFEPIHIGILAVQNEPAEPCIFRYSNVIWATNYVDVRYSLFKFGIRYVTRERG